jgi:hypothetical protein
MTLRVRQLRPVSKSQKKSHPLISGSNCREDADFSGSWRSWWGRRTAAYTSFDDVNSSWKKLVHREQQGKSSFQRSPSDRAWLSNTSCFHSRSAQHVRHRPFQNRLKQRGCLTEWLSMNHCLPLVWSTRVIASFNRESLPLLDRPR